MQKTALLLALLALSSTCRAEPETKHPAAPRPAQAVAQASATVVAPVVVTATGTAVARGAMLVRPVRTTIVDAAGVTRQVVTVNFD
jgi:hypothetical protein